MKIYDLNWPATSRPSYTMFSLVAHVSVTAWLAAAKLGRLVLSQFWTHVFDCGSLHWILHPFRELESSSVHVRRALHKHHHHIRLFTRFQTQLIQNKKVAHTGLQSIGFRSWSRFLAVSLQVMWVINPAVSCHYFLSGLQLLPQPLTGLLPVSLLGEQRHNGCEQFA